jgi:uncharacterized delta-60 repeat protein
MKQVTFTLTTLLVCLYVSAQVGVLDPTFNHSGTPGHHIHNTKANDDDFAHAVATHSDGRVVVAGYMANDQHFIVLRYTTSGELDATFGTGGMVKLRQSANAEGVPYAITVLSDNKILVAGSSWLSTKDFAILKLKENGTPDSTFGVNGWVSTGAGSYVDEIHAMAVQSDGKIVVAGTAEVSENSEIYDFAVARFNANGTIDGSFGGGIVITDINASDIPYGIAVQSDGKIVVSGTSNAETSNANFAVVRYNTDGSPDASGANHFGTGGIVNLDLGNGGTGSKDDGYQLAIQPDGKILMTGMSEAVSTTQFDVATIRLTTSGGLDATFNSTGAIVNRTGGFTAAGIAIFNNSNTANSDEGARSIILQSNGKILVAGDSDGSNTSFAFLLLRYNSDGTLDNTFDGNSNGNGVLTYDFTTNREYGYAMALHSNRLYFAGSTGTGNGKNTLIAAIQYNLTPLPLVLSQFYAQKQTSKVILQWQTASEEDVKHFVIERSNDGKTYKAIGQVAAAGNSTTTKNYMFADQSPFTPANNYYRLVMVDADGIYKYSKTLIVKFDGLLTTNITVSPNPVKDLLQVQLPDGLKGTVGIQIIDMQGRVVKRNNLASDGNALNTTIDVTSLLKGIYILKAQAGNTSVISRFTKN